METTMIELRSSLNMRKVTNKYMIKTHGYGHKITKEPVQKKKDHKRARLKRKILALVVITSKAILLRPNASH